MLTVNGCGHIRKTRVLYGRHATFLFRTRKLISRLILTHQWIGTMIARL